MTKYYLYIVKCFDDTLYTGITTDLERRVKEHNSSKLGASYTRARRPVSLVFSKRFNNRSTVSKEEARIKKLSRLEKLKLIKSYEPANSRRKKNNNR
ncbi:MAG: GIY-YIG nuclease family protein [Candidatus Falkowbacteria bacterium]|nr:GIY-YIG nuclease family protein [Candidatus Falkowbacteria bacterium]